MKKVFSLVFTLLGFMLMSRAQSTDTSIDLKNSSPEQRAQWQSNAMKNKLGLNDTQYQQVSAINLEYAKKGEEIKNSGDGKFSKYRKFKSMMSDKDAKLKKVLSPDQFTTYEEMKKEMMDKAKEAYKDKQ
jgi:hypothetical protein